MWLVYIALIVLLCVIVHKIRLLFKYPKLGALTMVTGGVKCGKTTFAVAHALRNHNHNVRHVKIANHLRKLFKRPLLEVPLLYSNIPLNVPYVPLTKSLILRNERFAYGSTILVSEASLLADSQLIRDQQLNQSMLEFFKLIGHELGPGGCIILDTQSISDVHYTIKRSLSNYFYIHHIIKVPFFIIAYVREDRYSEDNTATSTYVEDTEERLKRVIIPKRTWRYFDAYCYSAITDYLPPNTDVTLSKCLKCRDYLSFRKKEDRNA